MVPIPLSVLTLYADLVQQVETASRDEATVVATEVKGRRYLRLQRWVGASRTVEHLGRADDPGVIARAEAAAAEMPSRAERRRLVSALRRLLPAPSPALGKVLDAVAASGLFERGAVLVGTAAYGCYSPLVGAALPAASLMTQDAALATADLALAGDASDETMEVILRRADPTFASVPGLDGRAPPSRFRNRAGFVVDLLTPSAAVGREPDAAPSPRGRSGSDAAARLAHDGPRPRPRTARRRGACARAPAGPLRRPQAPRRPETGRGRAAETP